MPREDDAALHEPLATVIKHEIEIAGFRADDEQYYIDLRRAVDKRNAELALLAGYGKAFVEAECGEENAEREP